MHNELTKTDIDKMKEELDNRIHVLRPQLLAEVKRTREYGDLSENYEYRAAKQERNRNESRIRYLESMIETAKIVSDNSAADEVGLYDKVTVYIPDDEVEEVYQVVTTVRIDVLNGIVSSESPLGRALLHHKVGDTVTVHVNDTYSYDLEIRSIEKGEDTGELPINKY